MEVFKKLTDEHFTHISISSEGRLRNDETMNFYSLRVLKGKGLAYCDVNKVVDGVTYRKTVLISYEVAKAFIPLPNDADTKYYKAVHKKGFSTLTNNTKSIEWKSQSEISIETMKNPLYRNALAEMNKEKFKNYSKKKRIKKSKTILSKDAFLAEKTELENRLEFVNKALDTFYK